MAIRTIPIPNGPRWIMDVQLEGEIYTLRGTWNSRAEYWLLDIETADGDRLISGIRLVLGWPLLFDQHKDDLPPGELFVVAPGNERKEDPDRDSFEDGSMKLVYVSSDYETV
jgi:hypothetical protein